MEFGIKNVPVIFVWYGLIEIVGEKEYIIGNSQISGITVSLVISQPIDHRNAYALTYSHTYPKHLFEMVTFLDLKNHDAE